MNCPNEVGCPHSANIATIYHIFFGSNWVPFSAQLGTKSKRTSSHEAPCSRSGISISAKLFDKCSEASTGNDSQIHPLVTLHIELLRKMLVDKSLQFQISIKRPAHLLREQTFAVTIRPIRPMMIQKIHFRILLTADSLPLIVGVPSSCNP